MSQKMIDILQNVKNITESEASLSTLLDYERVLNSMDIYAFRNWKMGELVNGPVFGKYKISCTFMWPYSLMPDPSGAQRLLSFGAKINWEKSWLTYPIKIKTPDDYKPGTKKARLEKKRIWLVTIKLPKNLINSVKLGSKDILSSKFNFDDLDQAYEKDLQNQGMNNDQLQQQNNDDMSSNAGNGPEEGGM